MSLSSHALLIAFAIDGSIPIECSIEEHLQSNINVDYPSPKEARPWLRGTSYAHVFVEGSLTLNILIKSTGDYVIIGAEASIDRLVGRDSAQFSTQYFSGFYQAALDRAQKKWSFPKVPNDCFIEYTFSYELAD